MKEIKPEATEIENGEAELALLIKEAGNEARKRTKKMLENHFNKIKNIVSLAVSKQKESLPK